MVGRRSQQDLLDLSWRRIKTRCACHETSPPPESQLNRSTVPKDSESPELLHLSDWPSPVLYHPFPSFLSLSFFLPPLPPWPLILLARFLSRELKSDVLSSDPIRHASRLMSNQPALRRGFRTAERRSRSERRLDNCPYFQRDWSVTRQTDHLSLSLSLSLSLYLYLSAEKAENSTAFRMLAGRKKMMGFALISREIYLYFLASRRWGK